MTMADLVTLRDAMRRFTAERDWHRLHDPKSFCSRSSVRSVG